MDLSKLLEAVGMRQRERKQKVVSDFMGLVRRVAKGESASADVIVEVLENAGKTSAEFAKAVEVIQRRNELQKKLATHPALTAESEQLSAAIAKEDAAFQKLQEKHDAAQEPLHNRQYIITQELGRGIDYQRQFAETCMDPSFDEQIAALQKHIKEVEADKRRIVDELEVNAAAQRALRLAILRR